MPRKQVSVARFYDWTSDLGDCVSVSQLYQSLGRNSSSAVITPRLPSHGSVDVYDTSPRLHPLAGRMFLKDKTPYLTKGEKEIIEGICRNRSDIVKNSQSGHSDDSCLIRHSDAWLSGRQTTKPVLKYTHSKQTDAVTKCDQSHCGGADVTRNCNQFVPGDSYFCSSCIRPSVSTEAPKPTVYSGVSAPSGQAYHDGTIAPPSTPEKQLNKRELVPPINNGNGAIYVQDVMPSKESGHTNQRGRKYLNIFLPKVNNDTITESEGHCFNDFSNTKLYSSTPRSNGKTSRPSTTNDTRRSKRCSYGPLNRTSLDFI